MDQPQDRGPQEQPPVERPEYGWKAPSIIETNKDARNWAMLAHLSGLCGFTGLPSFVGPLVVWLIKKDEFAFVDDQGKEALNFHLGLLIAATVCISLLCICFVLFGILLYFAILIFALVMSIIAAVKASKGEYYRYPLNLRLIK